jgi:hypothetical protein
VLVPLATARHDPDAAARLGSSSFRRNAADLGRPLEIEVARVVDAATADDPATAARIAGADLIYLPGGDPSVIPTVLPGTAAWRSMLAARARGAVLAGASAGAMALGPYTWTPAGILTGLSVVRGLVVFPHADSGAWQRHAALFPLASGPGVGILGLGERTGVISRRVDGGRVTWSVVGEREVRWLPPGATQPTLHRHGDTLDLPA